MMYRKWNINCSFNGIAFGVASALGVVAVNPGAIASADVIYHEEFTTTTGNPLNFDTVGWKSHKDPSGTATNTASTASFGNAYVSDGSGTVGGPGFVYTFSANKRYIWWTDEVAALSVDISDVTTAMFDMRNKVIDQDLQFAIQVDGDWYVTTQKYNSAVSNEWADDLTVDFSTATWNSLAFTPETELGANGAPTALPLSGTVGAIGLYDELITGSGADGAFTRFDNVRLSAVPEPGSFALMGMGCLAVLRRKK